MNTTNNCAVSIDNGWTTKIIICDEKNVQDVIADNYESSNKSYTILRLAKPVTEDSISSYQHDKAKPYHYTLYSDTIDEDMIELVGRQHDISLDAYYVRDNEDDTYTVVSAYDEEDIYDTYNTEEEAKDRCWELEAEDVRTLSIDELF